MAESVERLLVRIDATTEQLRRELKAADAAVTKSAGIVEAAQVRMNQAWQGASKYVNQHQTELKLLGAAAVGGLAMATKAIAGYSDNYQRLQGQLKLVTKDQDELNRVYEGTKQIASETGQSLEATVDLYARMSRATEELGLSEKERLRITETINKTLVVSNATAAEAEGALRQLSQALASGVLRGEEFNSMSEQAPRLLKGVADYLGKTTGQLRAMAKEGQLTSDVVVSAIQAMGDGIDKEYSKMPMTVERAMNRITIAVQDAVGKADISPLIDGLEEFEELVTNPDTIDGLTAISSGIISMAVAAGRGAAALGQLSQFLGEATARAAGQVDIGNIAEVTDRIAVIEKRMKALAAVESPSKNQLARLELLREEYNRLVPVLGLSIELANNAANAKDSEAAATSRMEKVLAPYNERLKKSNELFAQTSKDLNAYLGLQDKKEKADAKANAAAKKAEAAAKKLADAEGRRVEKVKDTIDALDQQLTAITMNERAQVIYNATMEASKYAHGEELAAIVDKTVALYDQQQAIEATGEETKRAADAAEEAAERSAKAAEDAMQPWNDALQDMAANIDQGFSQAWVDAFSGAEDGFKSFANNMKNAFLNLLGNMAHLAFTRPIVMQISAAMGGMTGAGSAMAGTGVTGATGTFSIASMLKGITSATSGLYSAVGTLTNDLGMFSVSNAFNAKALSTTGWTMAGDVLGGIGGAYAGNQLYGSTSGTGNAIGGFVGSAVIPIPVLGAAIGSFVGGGIEKVLGNALGFGGNNNDGRNIARANFDFATGTFGQAAGSGNSWKKGEGKEQADFLDQIMADLVAFGEAIGGSTLSGGLSADSRGNLTFNGKAFSDANDLLTYAFDEIVSASDNVSDELKELIKGFDGTAAETAAYAASMVQYFSGARELDDALKDLLLAFEGTAEETMAYTNAIVAMSEAVQTNPVDLALKDMVTALENADMGISGAYYRQAAEVQKLIENYDGSAESATELNAAFMASRASAYELATAIMGISDTISTMLGAQSKYFTEAIMTPEELMTSKTAERDAIVKALETETDPGKILKLIEEFTSLNKWIFDNLDPAAQKARIGEFTGLVDKVGTISQEKLGTSLDDLQTSQDDINTALSTIVLNAAGGFQDAADDMSGHVKTFGEYVSMLVSRGIRIDITGGGGGEVTA